MYKFLFFFFALAAAALAYQYVERVHYAQTVVARVTLETNCAMELEAFAVKNLNSGEIREFQHGEAVPRYPPDDHHHRKLAQLQPATPSSWRAPLPCSYSIWAYPMVQTAAP